MENCDGRKISENEIAEEFQRRKEMAKGPSKWGIWEFLLPISLYLSHFNYISQIA